MPRSEAWLGELVFLLFLSPGFVASSSRYLYSEVIVPRKLESKATYDSEGDLSYKIKIEDHYRIVRLKQSSFITTNMPVYTYNLKGDLIADYPYIQDECYYSGYVEDVLDSQVILSTCAGLWGHVEIGTLSYEIEPIENSPTFQHFIYRKIPEQREPCRGIVEDGADLTSEVVELRMVDNDSPVPPTMGEEDFDHYTSTRFLEYYAVVDKSTFIANKRNDTQMILIMFLMMADVHSVFLPLGLRIYLVGLELWTEKDYITIGTQSLGITMNAFYNYARYELRHRVHFDHAGIITAKGHPAGLAWGDRFCLYTHVSVSAMRTYTDPKFDAEIIAHELGHSFGFSHDDSPANEGQGCDCNCTQFGSCIMVATGPAKCKRLSNCSREVYYNTVSKPGKECLLDIPTKIFRRKVCGNGVIDDSEECDCGQEKELDGPGIMNFFTKPSRKKQNPQQWNQRSENQYSFAVRPQSRDMTDQGESGISSTLTDSNFPSFRGPSDCRVHGCCQENCKLKPNIDCLYGLCCDECKFLEERTLCRKSATECDLPEYCSGTSADCPTDVYKQDGMPCSNNNNCFLGNCLDLERQCIILFGEGAEQAPLNCFKELNMRGDRSGNCGEEDQKYKKCHEQDVLCGRIQCTHVKKIPKMASGQGVVQTTVENALCWGTEFHLGFDVYDTGAVRDGTTCGPDKMCINRSCVDVAVLNYDCDFSGCNNHGVCNSKRNCHCSYGWAPPFCAGRGYGGSIDSGPPPAFQISTSVLVGLVTLAVLALVVLGLFVQRNKLQARFSGETPKKTPPPSADT